MHLSWALIVLANSIWVAILVARRRRDHSWLLPFYLTYTITDTFGYVCASSEVGGLDLLPLYRWDRQAWIAYATGAWLSWYLAPALFALKLQYERTRWWWWVVGIVPLVLISFSEYLGASTYTRRVLMHHCLEPICLMVAIFVSTYYTWTRSHAGKKIDFSAFAVLLTSVMLALKLIVWMDSKFRFNNVGSRAFFVVTMVGTIVMYFAWPKFRSRDIS